MEDDLALADAIARHVHDGTDHTAIRWDADRTGFRLRMRPLIPGSYLKETPERRRRFRELLRERLPEWLERPGNKWVRR